MVKTMFAVLSGAAAATIPTHKLNNGVEFPMMSIGTWQYDTATAEQVVKDALSVGFNHIDTANNYRNQKGVGAALKGVPRDSYFLTTKIPDGSASQSKAYLDQDLEELGLDYVDLMLVHFPPRGNSCKAMQEQWGAMEEFYKAGKAKAIGVSNFCPSSLDCIMQTATVTPAVNQVQYHVGMGIDPISVKSASEKYGIHLQAYSPLGNGESDLITGDMVSKIGAKYDKTGAQVALRWIQENGVSITTKTTKTSHMQEDLDVFTFQLSAEDKATLDSATRPSGSPSFMCSKFAATAPPTIPTHKLNNGVDFPMMSIGTWQYNTATAEQVVKDALSVGFNHIDTANDYNNQKGVGAALKGVDRSSYFLTTKVPSGSARATKSALESNLQQLGLDYVDLVLVHFPPVGNSCSSMQAEWGAMEEFYKAGKAKAIGVSNYCPSSLECIMQKATVTPAVNQVEYHVGMGVDPIGVKSANEKYGIHLQAYSPLGNGESDLITGDMVSKIGAKYDKTGAQVALRWIQENGVSVTTKTTKTSHMQEDLDVFTFQLSAQDKSALDSATRPSGKPSFRCNSMEVAV